MRSRNHSPLLHSALWVGLLGMLPYVQTLWFGLVSYDDPWLIQNNMLLRQPSWAGLQQIWFDLTPTTRLRLGAEYLPLRDLSVMLDWALYGTWFGGFHLTNMLLYGGLCVTLTRVIQSWSGRHWTGWIAGILFALHPLHVESVAWLSERKGLLAGLLMMAAALLFRRFARRPSVGSWLLCALCLVLAVWSKAVGVTGVALLGALLWFFPPAEQLQRRENGLRWWLPWAGLAGLAVVSLLAFAPVWKVGSRLVVETAYHGGTAGATAWLAARALGLYLEHLLLGGTLGIQYAVPDGQAGMVAGLVGLTFAVAMAALSAVSLIRRGRWTLVGLAAVSWWIFYLPVSQLVVPLQNYLADRYMLLASLAPCLLVAAAVGRLRNRKLRLSLVLLLVGLSGAMTVIQTRSWSSSWALYEQALRAHPQNVHAMIQMATMELGAGRTRSAARWLRRARKIRPAESRVLLHQGLLLARLGHKREAMRLFQQAARDPNADKARANLALMLSRAGRGAEALRHARQAVRIRALSAHNQRTLGVVTLKAGSLEEAGKAFGAAHRLEPHNAQNSYNLGILALKRGNREQAIKWLERALVLAPGHRDARGVLQQIKRQP